MKISVVIPYYNHWDLVHARLAELYKHLSKPIDIILVNDCSTEAECETGVTFWQKQVNHHTIRYIKNKENLGFGGSMNKGVKIAMKYDADVVVLLSNDVLVLGNFIPLIENKFNHYPDEKILIGGEIIYWDSGWNTIEGHIVPYANGWFLACKTSVWKTLGGFDPRYGKFDAEDLDLSTSAFVKKVKLVGLNTNILRHLSGQTINSLYPDRIEHTKRNIALWQEKWKPVLQKELSNE